ncbi:MAG: HD domain-containing protein [Deltaproteobacteria bacterium]|jgi:tRNA nucleotidyltransferase (CCA-adding enzyme)|nr:HD domain-containing protein [Deltaproteobacteria bacterium]
MSSLEKLNDPCLVYLAKKIQGQSGRLLLIGGLVRNELIARELHCPLRSELGEAPDLSQQDCDVVVFGLDIDELCATLSEIGQTSLIGHRTFSHRKVKEPSLVNVRINDTDFSLSLSRRIDNDNVTFDPSSSVREDSLARDFRANAVYFDPLKPAGEEFLDPLGGIDDIKARRLELCSEKGLVVDPLRILRAMSFVSRLSFTPGALLLKATSQSWRDLEQIPLERLWPEWRKWAASRWPRFGLDYLKTSGALSFWPQLAKMVGSPQLYKFHPEGDVWSHTLLVVEAMSNLNLPLSSGRVFLTMACLLHDIGKPLVSHINERGQVSTYGHAKAGYPVAKNFLQSIMAPSHIQKSILRIIDRHMDLSFQEPTTIKLRILARRLAPFCNLEHFWAIAMADWNGRMPFPWRFPWTLEEFLAPVGGQKGPGPIPLEAKELMVALGLSGGPTVGRLMDIVTEAFDTGQITDRSEALELAAVALADPDYRPDKAPIPSTLLLADDKESERAFFSGAR